MQLPCRLFDDSVSSYTSFTNRICRRSVFLTLAANSFNILHPMQTCTEIYSYSVQKKELIKVYLIYEGSSALRLFSLLPFLWWLTCNVVFSALVCGPEGCWFEANGPIAGKLLPVFPTVVWMGIWYNREGKEEWQERVGLHFPCIVSTTWWIVFTAPVDCMLRESFTPLFKKKK